MFGSSYMTDAIGLLKDDHRRVEELFERFSDAEDQTEKLELAQEICQSLLLHAHVEETLFYPALRKAGLDPDLLDEAEVEHALLHTLIDDIDGARADAELFDARVKVLGEYVRHHVDEEESQMMPQARSSGVDLDVLGEEILALKTKLETRVDKLAYVPGESGRVEVLYVDGRGARHS